MVTSPKIASKASIVTKAEVFPGALGVPSLAAQRDQWRRRLAAKKRECDAFMSERGYKPCATDYSLTPAIEDQWPEITEHHYLDNAMGLVTSRQMTAERLAGRRAMLERQIERCTDERKRTHLELDLADLIAEHAEAMAYHDGLIARFGWKRKEPRGSTGGRQ